MSRAPNSQPSNRRPLAAASDVPAATTPSASAERARQGRAMLWIGLCLIAVGAALVPVLVLLPTPERAVEAESMASVVGAQTGPSRARENGTGSARASTASIPRASSEPTPSSQADAYGDRRAADRDEQVPAQPQGVSAASVEAESASAVVSVTASRDLRVPASGVGAERAHQALDQLTSANRELRASFKSTDQVAALTPQAWAGWVEARMERVLQVAFDVIELDRVCKANVDASPLWKDAPDDAVEQLESDGGFLFLWNPPKERRSRPSPERVRAWSELAEQLNEERIVLQRAFKTEGAFQEELERRARALAEQTIPDERERALLLRSEPWLMLTERRLELERGRIARYLKEATP